MAESRFRELERWARLRIQAMIDLSRVPEGGTTGQVVTKTATGYEWATPASGSLTDGDKGDITVSGGGATWAIDADAVTYAKMQNVTAADRLLGRGNGGGAGNVEEITLGTNLSLTGTTLNAAGGNSFGTVAVSGQSDVVADAGADTLTLVGSGLTITTDAGTDTITFTVTGGSGLTQPQVMARSMGC